MPSPRLLRPLAALTALTLVSTVTAAALESAPPRQSLPTVHMATVSVPDGALDGGVNLTLKVKGSPEMVALTWPSTQQLSFHVRGHEASGWSDWLTLDNEDGGDAGPQRRTTASAGPAFLGHDLTEIQLRADSVDPHGLVVHTIDSNPVSITSNVASAATAPAGSPPIITRAQWGANEGWRTDSGGDCTGVPDYEDGIKIGVVHHTDSSNDYTAQDSAAIIRGIYDYHVHTNGWCDVAYSFFVDKYGQIFEGRYGGIRRAVLGAATGGVNAVSTSVAVIGTFTDQAPTQAAYGALVQILAWKLAIHGVNPQGTSSVTIGDGPTSKWAAGTTVTLSNIEGHQDSNKTDCPGQFLEAELPQLRNDVASTIAQKGYAPQFDLGRLSGSDRYGTAASIARTTYPSASSAFVARGDDFADALAADYLAGHAAAPILLSGGTSAPQTTIDTMHALGVTTVHLLGGTGALNPSVASQLQSAGFTVDRIAGNDRYETAASIAGAQGANGVGLDGSLRHTAVVSSGTSFPDALSAGSIVYAKHFPQLLTDPNALPAATSAALKNLGITHVLVTGGTSAVSDAVASQIAGLGIAVDRVAGATRFETSVALANLGVDSLGMSAARVTVATGLNFPDALAGGTYAGRGNGPILLTTLTDVPSAVCSFLGGHGGAVTNGAILGGTGALKSKVKWDILDCIEGL